MRLNPRAAIGRIRAATRRNRETAAVRREQESLELRERIYQQWSEGRQARRAAATRPLQPLTAGESDFAPAQVPHGVEVAAAWAWRFLVICGALAIVLWLVNAFMVVVLPLVIALLLAALATPLVGRLTRAGVPRKVASLLVVLIGLALIGGSFTFVGSQVANGFADLSDELVSGLGQVRDWLKTGPLHVSETQIDSVIAQAQETIEQQGKDSVGRITEVGTAVGNVVAGVFIVLFATYFFLADGPLIWAWLVRLFPRAGRKRTDSSGRVAWRSLTQFVRATVLVAATDAIGIMIVAAVLRVPFISAIGVLVFIGSFVPLIGAFVSGTVAVVVALIAKGPVAALIMFAGVVVVQQVEAHILQPFLMGRFVSVHPLGVIVAIALGVIVAGVPGALVAVPLVASLNAVGQHLADYTEVGEDPQEAAADQDVGEPLPPETTAEAVEASASAPGLAGTAAPAPPESDGS